MTELKASMLLAPSARAVLKAVLAQTHNFTRDTASAPRWVDGLLVRRHEYLPITATAR